MKKTDRNVNFFLIIMGVTVIISTVSLSYSREHGPGTVKGSLPTQNHSRSEYVSMAAIFCQEAIKAALKEVPGRVYECKLEEEKGFLVYGVEILSNDGRFMEVQVDAGNGQVLFSEEDKPEAENDLCEKSGCD